MSPEWLSAAAAFATFIVVAASAIAALVQLRHLRSSNQIAVLTNFRQTIESPEFTAAQRFVQVELPQRLADPAYARVIAAMPPFEGDYVAIRTVANVFETIGLFTKTGIVDKDITCDVFADQIAQSWKALAPVVTTIRANTNPAIWENFEYLMIVVQRFNKKHPTSYPAGWPRMPVDTSLQERARSLMSPAQTNPMKEPTHDSE